MIYSRFSLFLISVGVMLPSGILADLYSQNVIVREDEDAVIWCHFDDGTPFSECRWTTPQGVSCAVDARKPDCIAERSAKFIGDNRNCSLQISKAQNDLNGPWTCSLTDASSEDTESTEVQLTVALKAIVEFEDLFGSVEVVANQVTQLTCKAKNARPQGKFSWRIEIPGEAQPQYLTNSQNAKHDRQKNGVVTSTEVLMLSPLPEYNEGKIFCSYEQFDTDDITTLFEPVEVHEQIEVDYILPPSTELREIPSAAVGTNVNVTIVFGAHPKPPPQNVVWTITNAVKTIEVPTEANTVAKKNHYSAYPIQLVEENTYSATLTIQNVQEDEATLEHLLKLRTENSDEPVYHRFKINIEGMNDTEEKILEEGASNGATVAIICIVLVVLVLILSGALTFYAKKQNIWCFKDSEETQTKPNIDPEMQRPLQNTQINEAPIIKPGLRRPQTTE